MVAAEVDFHLVQFNIARAVAPMDHPVMADFVARLDEINALADRAPGFVWRLQDDSGNATNIKAFDDPNLLINMSMWTSVDTLFEYVYKSRHAGIFARRKDWFRPLDGPHLVLWWVRVGHVPDLEEAKTKLDWLRIHGPSPLAFTFKKTFPPPVTGSGKAA